MSQGISPTPFNQKICIFQKNSEDFLGVPFLEMTWRPGGQLIASVVVAFTVGTSTLVIIAFLVPVIFSGKWDFETF